MMTCVGIILPERIYETARKIRAKEITMCDVLSDISPWEQKLIDLLNSCPMAG
jgi:hypothetical protein